MLATVVDTKALLDSVIAALVTGLAVALVFSVAVVGAVRSADLGRAGRSTAALAAGALALVALAAVLAVIVLGVIVMTNK